jgi:Tol biopolymer transport system component
VTRANPHPRAPRAPRASRPAGGWRLPVDLAPALSAAGLLVIAVITLVLFGGSLPLPGGDQGPGGAIRTPTPSNIVVTDPRADVPGSLLYVKGGNIWLQAGDTARQLTSDGHDSMPVWAPDGASIYFVRTAAEEGRWPSAGETKTYDLEVPTLYRIDADGTGEPEKLLTGRLKRNGNTWSYFIREPAISPDGTRIAIVSDGPDPTRSNVVVKLLDPATGELTDPRLGQTQGLGHQDPAWSPDGRFLAYVRNAREGARGVPAIYRYNPANDRSAAITGGGYTDPSYSRDGRYLVATKTSNFGTDVVILDARTGVEQLLVTHDEQSFNPVWSPKGDAIAFFRVTHGVVDLYLVPLTGSGPTWTLGEPLALTISAGLDAASRPAWFIPADQLPPLPTDTPAAPSSQAPGSTDTP